jgi:single-strand DNA-binding protein
MNKVTLYGRAATEIELKYSSNDEKTAVGKFRIAVNRKNKEADFFNCVAFGKTAENIAKYFHKGDRILIGGRIQIDNYTNKDGKKVTTTNIIVEEFDFIESKKESGSDFMDLPETDEELPFKF